MWDTAKESLERAAETMKRQVERHRRPSRTYDVGDKVWLETDNIKLNVPSTKLGARRAGPFKITKIVGNGAYQLQLPSGWRALHPTYNESVLTPYTPPFAKHQEKPTPPPPEIVDGIAEHLVEKVKDSKPGRGGWGEYYVEWVGYGREADSWEPWSNMDNSRQAVHNFHLANPRKHQARGYKKWLEQGLPGL